MAKVVRWVDGRSLVWEAVKQWKVTEEKIGKDVAGLRIRIDARLHDMHD